jgi:hypothetical protein
MNNFDFAAYNKLYRIPDANKRFNEQLAAAALTRGQLFSKLAPLFMQPEYAGKYAACLLHRHSDLQEGERMVTNNLVTKPSVEVSPHIVAERWSSTGEEIEHRFAKDPTSLSPPPPFEFLAKFKSILDANGIDNLGVTFAPDKLENGFVFFETPSDNRTQLLSVVPKASIQATQVYQTMWIPTIDPDGQTSTMECSHNCGHMADKSDESPKATLEGAAYTGLGTTT